MQEIQQASRPLMTISDVARQLKVAPHRLRYAINDGQIEARQRAGIIRLYDRDQLPSMVSALRRVAGRRRG